MARGRGWKKGPYSLSVPMANGTYARIYALVRRIPRGRVATYGQVARLAGLAGHARQVGYALAALSDDPLPWHRVVNAKGEISARSERQDEIRQRRLLEREGIVFDSRGRMSLSRFRWTPYRLVASTRSRKIARLRRSGRSGRG